MAGFLGNVPAEKYTALQRQTFSSPTGTSFTLDQAVTNPVDIDLYIDNVKQNPASYSVSGTALTTSTISSPSTMYCIFNGKAMQTVNPPDDSVGLSQIASGTDGNLITFDASGNPAYVATGNDGQVLTSAGAGQPCLFEDASAGGAWTLIGTAVASSSASLTITGLDTSTYESFCIRLTNLVGASDGQALWVRLGDSGGIDSGGSDYSWVGVKNRSGSSSPAGNGSASIGQIIVDTAFGTGTGESVSCTMWLSAASATDYPNLTYHSLAYSSVPDSMCNTGGGSRKSAINVTQIQILSSSGDLTSGRMTVWGIAHA